MQTTFEQVEQLSTIEIDQQLSEQAYNMGFFHGVSGLACQLYMVARFQGSYDIGWNRGSGRGTEQGGLAA